MDIARMKELAGMPQQLNEVSDQLVGSAIRGRLQDNWKAVDRQSVANQTPASQERSDAAREVAKKKLGGVMDKAAQRNERRRRLSFTAMEAQRMAGMVIEEAYDDDDEDPDVKIANSDKRQREFEKRNAKAIKDAEDSADVADDMDDSAKKAASAEKKEASAEKTAPAAEKATSAAEAKTKGRKQSDRGASCRAWMADHPGATRGQFVAHCKDLGMSAAHANTSFYALKKKIASSTNEAFMIVHPLDSNSVLAENTRLRRYEWIDICEHTDYTTPMVFDSLLEADAIVSGMGLMSQSGVATEIGDDGESVE